VLKIKIKSNSGRQFAFDIAGHGLLTDAHPRDAVSTNDVV